MPPSVSEATLQGEHTLLQPQPDDDAWAGGAPSDLDGFRPSLASFNGVEAQINAPDSTVAGTAH
jgi:hypothetical protein